MTHRSRLFALASIASITAIGLSSSLLFGCGGSDCTAACIANAQVHGSLTLPDTNAHAYDVTYCVGTTCREFDLAVSGSTLTITPVATSGTAYGYATVTRVDATQLTLELSLVNFTPTTGAAVTVTVSEPSTSTTLRTISLTLPAVQTVQVCSDTCEQVEVDWDAI